MNETLEVLNKRLIEHFGLDTETNQAMFRIVWANDQLEMRLVHVLDSGIELIHPEVRQVKKYPFFRNVHVLERLVVVPYVNQHELPASPLSYEPIWTYWDVHRNPLPPLWEPTKIVIDILYAALGKRSLRNHVEDVSPEAKEQRIKEIQEELFGNETEASDALAYREGIVVPENYTKETK